MTMTQHRTTTTEPGDEEPTMMHDDVDMPQAGNNDTQQGGDTTTG